MFNYKISKRTAETNPYQPASEDDTDAQFISIEADNEFSNKKNLRED
jgi:hypothetical protein